MATLPARDARLVDADEFVLRDGGGILHVVGVSLGGEGELAGGVLGNGRDAVADDGGSVALGVKEGDDVSLLDVGRGGLAADDEVTRLDLRVHGVREHDEGDDAAHAGDLVGVGCALVEQDAVDHQDGDEQHAQDDADGSGDLVRGGGGGGVGGCRGAVIGGLPPRVVLRSRLAQTSVSPPNIAVESKCNRYGVPGGAFLRNEWLL